MPQSNTLTLISFYGRNIKGKSRNDVNFLLNMCVSLNSLFVDFQQRTKQIHFSKTLKLTDDGFTVPLLLRLHQDNGFHLFFLLFIFLLFHNRKFFGTQIIWSQSPKAGWTQSAGSVKAVWVRAFGSTTLTPSLFG